MNYFEIFEIPVGYRINEEMLLQSYLRKQSAVHPDANGAESAESARLNVAYRVLLDPIERARHLLEINGKEADKVASDFTSEMFSWREKYESLTSTREKEIFREKLSTRVSELIDRLYDLENNMDEFEKYYSLLRFVSSFREKIKSDGYDWN
ncbi:MAG: hypothetical protein LBO02_02345 [Holosporaceae bacterium]|jgi:molecular chaperone HscB|nr:hypothetical protein [Holosporaceae bacterium]